MSRRRLIGWDRKINLEWLDAVAGRTAQGDSPADVRRYLAELLAGVVRDGAKKGALSKTVTVLTHIWNQVPEPAIELRNRALALLPDCTLPERLALHWAMGLASYPFFTDTVTTVGRLLNLQGRVALNQVVRRLVEGWGDRSTVPRAAQRILRSLVQWGILQDTERPGVYTAILNQWVVGGKVAECLVEAALVDRQGRPAAVEELLGSPAFFPFRLDVTIHQLRQAPQFRVSRQGLDMDLVELA